MANPPTTGPGFINPYNFVRTTGWPVHYKVPRALEKFAGLSGRITCRLEVVTPLCVPDAEASAPFTIASGPHQGEERWHKRFCRLPDGTLFVPGASLKGMLRAVAEAVSNSCFAIFTQDLAVFRDNRPHVPTSRGEAQLVVDPGGSLRLVDSGNPPAPRHRGLFNQVRNRPHQRRAINRPPPQGLNVPPEVKELYEGMVGDPNFQLDEHRNNQPRRPRSSECAWLLDYANQTGQGNIWWYREHSGQKGVVVDFGRNFRYKGAYHPRQALAEWYLPCNDPGRLCPCCALFGMVDEGQDESVEGEGQVRALAGRVAVGPGHWIGGESQLFTVSDPKILGAPKMSCRSFYLEPSAGGFDVTRDEFVRLNNGRLVPNPVRGRKFYWHHSGLTSSFQTPTEWQHYLNRRDKPGSGGPRRPPETNQNAVLEVLMPKARFEFAVEFEGLNRFELGLLFWSLVLPDVPNGAHHLGLGKPIGLGSVVLSIRSIDLIDRKERYSSLFRTGAVRRSLAEKDEGSLDLKGGEAAEALKVFRANLEAWNGSRPFLQLPNVADLCAILSRNQPAQASLAEVPIIYPPGPANTITDPNDPHPEELHHLWFAKAKRWSEPLLTVGQIASGCRQTLAQ
jgi:hypothetical protein